MSEWPPQKPVDDKKESDREQFKGMGLFTEAIHTQKLLNHVFATEKTNESLKEVWESIKEKLNSMNPEVVRKGVQDGMIFVESRFPDAKKSFAEETERKKTSEKKSPEPTNVSIGVNADSEVKTFTSKEDDPNDVNIGFGKTPAQVFGEDSTLTTKKKLEELENVKKKLNINVKSDENTDPSGLRQ